MKSEDEKNRWLDVTGHAEPKRSWCSVGRGIHRRDDPLLFLMIIGICLCALVVFLVVAFEAITR